MSSLTVRITFETSDPRVAAAVIAFIVSVSRKPAVKLIPTITLESKGAPA